MIHILLNLEGHPCFLLLDRSEGSLVGFPDGVGDKEVGDEEVGGEEVGDLVVGPEFVSGNQKEVKSVIHSLCLIGQISYMRSAS